MANDIYIAGGLIGYSLGLAVTILLLVFTMRAASLPGTPRASIQCALCALFWNLGGLAQTAASALGLPKESSAVLFALSVQFTSAAIWPVPMLSAWHPLAILPWQKTWFRVLQIVALFNAGAITAGLWAVAAFLHGGFRHEIGLKKLTSFNGSLLLVMAALLVLRGRLGSRTARLASLTILLGVLATTFGVVIQEIFRFPGDLRAALIVVSEQSTLLVVLGAFFLFARFRYADLFVHFSVRIVLAGILALLLTLTVQSRSLWYLANLTRFPDGILVFTTSILVAALLLSFVFIDRQSARFINHWVFQAPDYRQATRQFGEMLMHLHGPSEIGAAAGSAIEATTEVENARLIPRDSLPSTKWFAEPVDGEPLDIPTADPIRETLSLPNLELLVPVVSSGHLTGVLCVSPGPARRGLISQEVAYLRTVAAQIGARLDSLRLEHEAVERQSREARLLQQVTEAELRALRAQINPHFLFNSLNAIANLVVTNPAAAETMTLRLARVFRHVLAHSSRSLTSIHEEVDFLKTYLQIEEARFGGRLKVEIDISPEVVAEHIPSLILQPIVENALKHGLAPKLGPGYLNISAHLQGDQVCIKVEDDGIGLMWAAPQTKNGNSKLNRGGSYLANSSGVGLRNISQRLATLYQDRAQVNLEGRESGGTRVTLLIPRGQGGAFS